MMRENSVTDTQGHFSKLTESLSNLTLANRRSTHPPSRADNIR